MVGNQVRREKGHNPAQRKGDIPANFHSQTVGERGPVLEQDTILHETLETFVHTKILERPVHVKGFGAFGYFETVYSMAKLHEALLFTKSWAAGSSHGEVFTCRKQ